MKRLFLALDITPEQKSLIEHWREKHCNLANRKILTKNFHLTLCFIGNLEQEDEIKLIKLVNSTQTLRPELFSIDTPLEITHLGLFKKPKVLYLGVNSTPSWLVKLQAQLSNTLTEVGYQEHHDSYRPHISIYRKAIEIPKVSTLKFPLTVKSFSLYHSRSTEQGVSYQAIKTWYFN